MASDNAFYRLSVPVAAMAVFFPSFQVVRPADILFTLSDALYIVAGALLIFGGGLRLRPFGGLSPAWYVAFSMMLFGLLVGSLVNGSAPRWLPVAAQYAFSFIFLPMLLLDQGRAKWLLLAKAYVAGTVMLELGAYIVYFITDGSYEAMAALHHNFWSGAGRLGSFVGNPNSNAAIIGMTIPFLLYLRRKDLISTLTVLAALAVLIPALLFTASTGGLIGTVLGVFVFAVVGGLGISRKYAVIGLIGLTGLFLLDVPLPKAFERRIAPAIESGDISEAGTFADRYDLMVDAWRMTGETSLIGLGVDQFREVSHHQAPVHNSHLLLWTEGGLTALIGWLAMLSILFLGGAHAFLQGRREAAGLSLSVFAVFALFSMSSAHMYSRAWMTPVLLAMAPVFAPAVRRREDLPPMESSESAGRPRMMTVS